MIRLVLAAGNLLSMMAWWDQVTDTPDERRMMVFSRGTFIGLNDVIELGGQFCPISMFGLILLWKYAQKNDMKNSTSEVMNRIIPILSPVITLDGCSPWIDASRDTSRHH